MDRSLIKVLVIMGGPNSEREVSLSSGASIIKHLQKLSYNVSAIELSKNIANDITKFKPDIVFNAMHGKFGEDGCLPGLLNILDIPYTHSGVLSSAICMHKPTAKEILKNYNINLANGKVYSYNDIINDKIEISRPFVIKPVDEGSSVGTHIIYEGDIIDLSHDKHLNKYYLIEEYIPGKEVHVGVINGKSIGAVEIRPIKHKFYDYESKYQDGFVDHIMPATLNKQFLDEAMNQAELVHKILGCRGISRSDFIFNTTKEKLYFLEINSHPGFTSLSLVPEMAKYMGISFADICDFLIKDALCLQ